MMDFLLPEMVNAAIAERSREAESIRITKEVWNVHREPRLRPRLALMLGALAARIHPEAARYAVGLRAPPRNGPSSSHGWLCLGEE